MTVTSSFIVRVSVLMSLVTACSTSPTGRPQIQLLPESQMEKMGEASYAEMKSQEHTLDKNSPAFNTVRCVSDRLLQATGETPSEWEVQVFEDDTPNAFALPGRKIGVNSGMLKTVENQDQLAAVIGHEIGHVKARHGNERASQRVSLQVAMTAADLYFGRDSQTDQLILGALGVGAQYGILLPYSRAHESEADTLGIRYMAEAGFDPRQAPRLWEVMKAQSGSSGPELMSTHPSPDTRITKLKSQVGPYQQTFAENRNRFAQCPSLK